MVQVFLLLETRELGSRICDGGGEHTLRDVGGSLLQPETNPLNVSRHYNLVLPFKFSSCYIIHYIKLSKITIIKDNVSNIYRKVP